MPNIISPLGATVKPSSDIRLIHDCSHPTGRSLNDYAAYESIHFQSLDDARQFITPGSWMSKVDLASAYCSVRIHPSNYCANGIAWTFEGDKEETILTDVRLPFGAKRSVFIFDRLLKAVVTIMRSKGLNQILNYLDDYLVIEPTRERCLLCLRVLLKLLRDLGFSISYTKLIDPCQKLTFLGIFFDSLNMTFSLPYDKMTTLQTLISDALTRHTFTKRLL